MSAAASRCASTAKHGALVDDGTRLIAVPPRMLDQVAHVPSNQRYSKFVVDTLDRIASGRPPLVSLREFATATALVDDCLSAASLTAALTRLKWRSINPWIRRDGYHVHRHRGDARLSCSCSRGRTMR